MTGSERSKQARRVRLLAQSIRIHALDLAFCANCPSCMDTGLISREQIVKKFSCSMGDATRALAQLQQAGFLGSPQRQRYPRLRASRPGGQRLWPVLQYRGCQTFNDASSKGFTTV